MDHEKSPLNRVIGVFWFFPPRHLLYVSLKHLESELFPQVHDIEPYTAVTGNYLHKNSVNGWS